MDNRPVGRKKNVTGGGSGVHRRGDAIGGGPVLNSGGMNGGSNQGGDGPQRSGGRSPMFLVAIALLLLLGGGGGLSSFLGGDTSDTSTTQYQQTTTQTQTSTSTGVSSTTPSSSAGSTLSMLGSLLGSGYSSYQGASSGANAAWSGEVNTGRLNTSVSDKARAKRTVIKGNGQDTVTIMVYMCGADLESRSGMASRDLQEMLAANVGDNVNLIIYTGGAKQWQNNVVSSQTNQLYQIKNGKLSLLKDNLGSVPMTKPETLSGFINYAASSFPANRNILIFWDHGGGSTGGYGYDEKFPSAGAMSLAGINTALKNGGVTFDFVGFDTCLMATVENALVVSNYADYLVASEETEPGVGWYYTDWLNAISKDTSIPTIDVSKIIIDTFTEACAKTCPGQKTTLSLIDLAELSQTVPTELAEFSKDTSEMINGNEFKEVSNARSSTREFASARIDQVDLIDFANRIGTQEAKDLADVLRESIKYNRTSSNMTNAYGLSIYFPYRTGTSGKISSMVDTYEDIGMDEEYAKCIASFAGMGAAGQAASGSTGSAMPSLFGELSGSSASGTQSAEMIGQLINAFLSSSYSSAGTPSATASLLGRSIDVEKAADYISKNQFDASALFWTTNEAGEDVISLTEDQWSMVQDLELNLYYDDGEGLVDLGLDNVFDFDEKGNLKSQTDKTWISIDGQVVGYKVVDIQGNQDSYAITGRVPCLINGDRAELILVFDSENEDGYVAGAAFDYVEGETETVPKNLTELQKGDKIDFLCDAYSYGKEFDGAYKLGEQMVLQGDMGDMVISNTYLGDGDVYVMYRFTDIY